MGRFRKKPVVIEARRLSDGNVLELYHWIGSGCEWSADPAELRIRTLEGVMLASDGDWIICGVKGEFYPCKPDIFEATYEACEGGRDHG